MIENLLIWVAHPKPNSYCRALAEAYQTGAEAAGLTVRTLHLSDMAFNADSLPAKNQAHADLEEDLVHFQRSIIWADHILIVHPCWWGGIPARTKAALDLSLLSGFAYAFHGKGMGWDKLLEGRSADVIMTADTPKWIDTLIYRASARRIWKKQILGFCGIKTRHVKHFGSVQAATDGKRAQWIKQAAHMGYSLTHRQTKHQPSTHRSPA